MFGQPKISQFDLTAGRHEDVGRLNVPVNDAAFVRRFQSPGDLDGQIQKRFQRQRLCANSVFQRLAFQQLHGNIALPVVLADVMDGADIRMI